MSAQNSVFRNRFSFVGREFFISNGEEEEDFQCRRGKKRKTFSVEEGRKGRLSV